MKIGGGGVKSSLRLLFEHIASCKNFVCRNLSAAAKFIYSGFGFYTEKSFSNEYYECRRIFFKAFGIKFRFSQSKIKETGRKCIVIVGPGGLGDYFLCRSYFKYLKETFKKYKIIFLSSVEYTDIAEVRDCEHFDMIIEYNRFDPVNIDTVIKYMKNFKIAKLINMQLQYKQVVDHKYRDKLIKKIKSPEKIIGYIDIKKEGLIRKGKFKKYTEIIMLENPVFETELRREFFEKLLKRSLPVEDIHISTSLDFKKKLIAVCIFATAKKRRIKEEKIIAILNHLAENTGEEFQIVLTGSVKEKEFINNIILKTDGREKFVNLAGETSTAFLPILYSNCEFLISVETAAVHAAQCVNLKTICLCSGMYYRRFQPYDNVKYIYPSSFEQYIQSASQKELAEIYNYSEMFDIDDIETEKILQAVNEYLNSEEQSYASDAVILG